MNKHLGLCLLVFAAGAACLFAAEETGPSLIDAAKNGDKFASRTLPQKKADVNAVAADGSTALYWAAYRDDLEIADALLRAGAKVNAATDLKVTPLWPLPRAEWEPLAKPGKSAPSGAPIRAAASRSTLRERSGRARRNTL